MAHFCWNKVDIESDNEDPCSDCHGPVAINHSPGVWRKCVKYCLKTSSQRSLGVSKQNTCSKLKNFMVWCNNQECGFLHTQVMNKNKWILFKLPDFRILSVLK